MFFTIVIQALWFFLPAYFANMFPVIFTRVRFLQSLKKPINTKIFGDHKTYYGFATGMVGALVAVLLQMYVAANFPDARWLFLFPYSYDGFFALGFLLGFGALLGDLIKSFFKRKLCIPPGVPFVPFDQLDFVIGGLFLTAIVYHPPLEHVFVLLLLTPLLHLGSNLLMYMLGLKKVWW